jgi:FOG: PKD repeat
MVEFALIAPVMLLFLLVAIDFGRVYLGWINLQQMARVAANYAAEHASAWNTPRDSATIDTYRRLVANDAQQINCVLPSPIPDPVLSTGTALGASVDVHIDCQFTVLTPIMSQILGGTILTSGSATFPVKEGAVGLVPGGGGPLAIQPTAKFVGSPQSGWVPLAVTFLNQSTGSPTSWTWDFSVNPSGTGSGTASPSTSLAKDPPAVTYGCVGTPGDTCTFGVSLKVGSVGGQDTKQALDYITVTVPPATGPIAEFTANPRTGVYPLLVNFGFVDLRAGSVVYTKYEWDFTGDGTFDATGQTTSHSYPTEGTYSVRLRVTDDAGATSEIVKTGYIVVGHKICVVPNFAGTHKNSAQAMWATNGFTTQVRYLAGTGNYTIGSQTITGGTIDPQPDACASIITVGPQ